MTKKLSALVGFVDKNLWAIAFLLSAGATIASLILSNIYDLIPCELCWYQRILMFPIPLIAAVAILRKDVYAYLYVLPFAVVGGVIALWQSLLQWGVIPEDSLQCSLTSVSCGEPEILWLGFLTIPFGAFLSFAAILVLMLRARKLHPAPKMTSEAQKKLSSLLLLLGLATVVAVSIIMIVR